MRTPRLRQVFLERGETSTSQFQAWFRNSKVVDDSGQPAVVYHSTRSPTSFDVFRQFHDLGHHFGSIRAAEDRLDFTGEGPAHVYPVYLSIQHPLDLGDEKTWEPTDIAHQLWKSGVFTHDEYIKVGMKRGKDDAMPTLVASIKKRGFDGVRYVNQIEDRDSTSWIAFDPWQIKSIFNRGTWDKRRGSIME